MSMSQSDYHIPECRSFWKTAAHETFPVNPNSFSEDLGDSYFERARVHPRFLHSNATSHKWEFGAIAELVDNAVDEISNGATFIKIDRCENRKCTDDPILLFQDDGGGMGPDDIRKCMSLGFSSKTSDNMIGQYGNGFKTSTMRLGADVIVFSCKNNQVDDRETRSIGLLSYTFLTRTMRNDIIVPMLDFEIVDDQAIPMIFGSQSDWDFNLKVILEWSPFSSLNDLLMQFNDIGCHGTKIFVYNLWYNDDGLLELDFKDDIEDIRLQDSLKTNGRSVAHTKMIQSHISYSFRYSLRDYISILYLKKMNTFSIILRGKPVQHLNISKQMKFDKVVKYRPHVEKKENIMNISVGFSKEAPLPGMYGLNVYHKNRLIKPFWNVFPENLFKTKCIIGMLEANYIKPAHDKQDFERSILYNSLEKRLKQIVKEYWKTHKHHIEPIHNTGSKHVETNNASQVDPSSNPVVVEPLSSMDIPVIEVTTEMPLHSLIGPTPHLSKNFPNKFPPTATAIESRYELEDENIIDTSDPKSFDELCENNLILLAKREELKKSKIKLMQEIDELKRELAEVKKKNSILGLDV
ncbi:MORC family CW-type zinc finger 3a [Zostera marina]|uniref:MORC family CW-type zinc finger 3a n=1 Tax=Zostera marina TaxID=29655 RepID=A0A0K9PBH2_ZOSMR|nr:MORC family CW-type zinc finger 3a [Zostera marina]